LNLVGKANQVHSQVEGSSEYAESEMLALFNRMLRRKPVVPRVGPQGEEHEALLMEQRWRDERVRFAENVIKKVGHKNLPFLDDPFH
jgi:hypothetical protein